MQNIYVNRASGPNQLFFNFHDERRDLENFHTTAVWKSYSNVRSTNLFTYISKYEF